ncbi:MAG: ABC transporter substrate-binding protein, partial [Gammaproteobacteria bacterium]|nr:ABC transporter substrate-binding protein [Gammaproteobacteria bacterium]
MKSLKSLLLIILAATLWSCGESGNDGPQVSTLNRGLSSDPESLDPHKMRSVQAGEVLRDIGEGLASYSATGELVAGAAESWNVSDDGLTYTFTIRPEARWSNGDAVTAEDFVFSLRRLVDPATASFNAHMIADVVNAAAISSGDMTPDALAVEAVAERTLLITLSQPTPYFLALLTYPSTFPVHPGSVAEHGDAFTRAGALLSNGAYQLDAWEPGSVLKLSR